MDHRPKPIPLPKKSYIKFTCDLSGSYLDIKSRFETKEPKFWDSLNRRGICILVLANKKQQVEVRLCLSIELASARISDLFRKQPGKWELLKEEEWNELFKTDSSGDSLEYPIGKVFGWYHICRMSHIANFDFSEGLLKLVLDSEQKNQDLILCGRDYNTAIMVPVSEFMSVFDSHIKGKQYRESEEKEMAELEEKRKQAKQQKANLKAQVHNAKVLNNNNTNNGNGNNNLSELTNNINELNLNGKNE